MRVECSCYPPSFTADAMGLPARGRNHKRTALGRGPSCAFGDHWSRRKATLVCHRAGGLGHGYGYSREGREHSGREGGVSRSPAPPPPPYLLPAAVARNFACWRTGRCFLGDQGRPALLRGSTFGVWLLHSTWKGGQALLLIHPLNLSSAGSKR